MGTKRVAIYNTFRVEVYADECVGINGVEDAENAAERLKKTLSAYYILGGGSNVLFTEDFAGIVLHPTGSAMVKVAEDARRVTYRIGAGANWDQVVARCCEEGLWGLENLSGIPGSVGASPVQNIGAYGCSCSETLKRVHTYDLAACKEEWFGAEELALGYRWSKFKEDFAGRKIILDVEYQLSKEPRPRTAYGRLPEVLNGTSELTPQDVRAAVLKIRDAKLPRVEELGSAGSFFKNPELSAEALLRLQRRFPDVPTYSVGAGRTKVPAGWIIDRCGWRGKHYGEVGIYPKQALIIVNLGKASGREIDAFAKEVSEDVYRQCGVRLAREVNMIRPYRISDFK